MLKLQFDPMTYTPPKSPSQVSIRVDNAYKRKAEGIRRCWAELARLRGDDKVAKDDGTFEHVETDLAHVWRTMLEAKVDEEVAALIGDGVAFPPLEDEKAWADLYVKIASGHAKSKQSK